MIIGLLIFWAILGAIVGAIAQSKGRGFGGWFVYGALVFPIALVHILLEPDERKEAAAWISMAQAAAHRPCPWCAEPIKNAALVCRHCGRDAPPTPGASPDATAPNPGRHRGRNPPLNFD